MSEMEYEGNETIVATGHCLVLTSDGITEARNEDRVMFGFERMRETVASASIGGALQSLLTTHQAFTGSLEQEDDITLIALNRLPQQ